MKHLYIIILLAASTLGFAQQRLPIIPPGLASIDAIDYDNDGYALFDLVAYHDHVKQYFLSNGYNPDDFTFEYFLNAGDCTNSVNQMTAGLYTNIILNQNIRSNVVYNGTDDDVPNLNFWQCQYLALIVIPGNGDMDGDGIMNGLENTDPLNPVNDNTDGDAMPNYNDPDDDNDGVPTFYEDYNGNGNYFDDDLNANGVPDYLDAAVIALSTADTNRLSIKVIPNPASGKIRLQIENNRASDQSFAIYDIQGREVLQSASIPETIDISGLSAGMFFVKVTLDNKTYLQKLIVK